MRKFEPDFLINAVTLHRTVAAFEEAAPFLSQECILGDVASIKGEIAGYYKKAGFRFVSVHPMFGPTFADMESPLRENGVIISESCDEGRDLFVRLFTRLGVRIFTYSFEEHDRMMAYSLTTPFLASLAFAACVDIKAVPGTTSPVTWPWPGGCLPRTITSSPKYSSTPILWTGLPRFRHALNS